MVAQKNGLRRRPRRLLRRGKVKSFDPATGTGVVLTNGGEEVTFGRSRLDRIGLTEITPGVRVQVKVNADSATWIVSRFMAINGTRVLPTTTQPQ